MAYAVLLLALLGGAWWLSRHGAASQDAAGDRAIALPAPAMPASVAGRALVVDGDTLQLAGLRLRLDGIDAPEFAQTCGSDARPWPCGRAAADALRAQVGGRELRCRLGAMDRYGRTLARCTLDGDDLARWMVANGWAVAFRFDDDAFADDYGDAQHSAERARIGLWRDAFTRPVEWRRLHPPDEAPSPAASP